jgi:hypothetical protein
MTDDYASATKEDRTYGYWGDATDNRVGAAKVEGYDFW